jgi:hypothetical protein
VKALTPVNPADSASVSVIINHHGDPGFTAAQTQKYFGNNVADASQVFRNTSARRAGDAISASRPRQDAPVRRPRAGGYRLSVISRAHRAKCWPIGNTT